MAKKFNPKYKINTLKVFSRVYSGESKELRNALRPVLSSQNFKFFYGKLVTERIMENTQKSLDKNGKSFSGSYSKAYRESLEFKIWKGGQRKINLTQTEDMLTDMDKISDTSYTITFGFNDQDNRNKATGHITGRYGKHGKTAPRDFFGLPKKQEEELLKEAIIVTRGSDSNITADLFSSLINEFATGIVFGGEG